MTAPHSVPFAELLEDYLASASPDLVRQHATPGTARSARSASTTATATAPASGTPGRDRRTGRAPPASGLVSGRPKPGIGPDILAACINGSSPETGPRPGQLSHVRNYG